MSTMKVSELTGPKLAQWVALALGYVVEKDGDYPDYPLVVCTPDGDVHSFSDTLGWRPDIQWDRGGPVIDQKRINLHATHLEYWLAWEHPEGTRQRGETALIAAMRCVVASKYGDEVPVSEKAEAIAFLQRAGLVDKDGNVKQLIKD